MINQVINSKTFVVLLVLAVVVAAAAANAKADALQEVYRRLQLHKRGLILHLRLLFV